MRILITGGAGFIGSHLADALLLAGHQVAILDDLSSGSVENVPASAQFFNADIRDTAAVSQAFQEFRPDAVSHHAAQISVSRSVREPALDADVNIIGLINVCSAARNAGTQRIVFASSGGVLYGEQTRPAPEVTPARPASPYGISKWAGEEYLKFFQSEFGLSSITVRYANVYGERQNPHGEAGVIAIFCTRLLSGQPTTINGDGKYIRDYVHVSDVVRANVLALESTMNELQAVNIGTGVGTDVNELAETIRSFCQSELSRHGSVRELPQFARGPARAGDIRSSLLDCTKALSLLGWSPRIELKTGLERTVNWFAENTSGVQDE